MSASRSSERLRGKRLAQRTKRSTQTPCYQESPAGQNSTAFEDQPKSGKRRRVQYEAGESSSAAHSRPYGRVKGRRGKLEFMHKVPLDVIYEIFGLLEPLDLLHISWASKSLNAIVTSKPAKFLWEKAYQRLSMSGYPPPACPPTSILRNIQGYFLINVAWNAIPRMAYMFTGYIGCGYARNALTVTYRFIEVTGMEFLRQSLFQKAIPFLQRIINGRFRKFLLTSDYNEVAAVLSAALPDSEKWKAYVEQKTQWVALRQTNERIFKAWELSRERDRDGALEEIRERRRDDIIARLVELDWEDELDHLSSSQFYNLPGFGVAKPLTDKAWETLRPELIQYLETAKTVRLEDEKFERISDRREFIWRLLCLWSMIESQFRSDTLPQILDIATTEPFRTFILEDADELPGFLVDMGHISSTFKSFADSWNQDREQFLGSLVPGKTGQPNGRGKAKTRMNTAALKRATTFFQCPYCTEPISFPRILAHGCLLNRSSTKNNRRDTDPDILAAFSFYVFPRPWFSEAQNLTFDQDASNVAKSIIEECGENPDRITQEQMDEKDLRLECRICTEQKKGRYAMKWRMAILHEIEKHQKPSEDTPVTPSRKGKNKEQVSESNWRVVSDSKDLAQVRSKEAKDNAAKPPLECKWCRRVIRDELMYLEIHFTFCNPYLGTHLGQDFLPGRSRFSPPDEEELRALYRTALDKSIKEYEKPVRLSMKK